jgi:hypothetical protein
MRSIAGAHTFPVVDTGDTENELVRHGLDLLARKLDGQPAAAATIARKRRSIPAPTIPWNVSGWRSTPLTRSG